MAAAMAVICVAPIDACSPCDWILQDLPFKEALGDDGDDLLTTGADSIHDFDWRSYWQQLLKNIPISKKRKKGACVPPWDGVQILCATGHCRCLGVMQCDGFTVQLIQYQPLQVFRCGAL